MRTLLHHCVLVFVLLVATLSGCSGGDGPAGPPGPPGPVGPSGPPGSVDAGDSYRITTSGLKLTIEAFAVAADGLTTVDFKITDANDAPLDRSGVFTEASVSSSFILAYLDEDSSGNPRQYITYTTRQQTSPITSATETQSATDSGGTYVALGIGDGRYRYTFKTMADPTNALKTHTVGIYASRSYRGVSYVSNQQSSIVPGGGTAKKRDVITGSACNSCHTDIRAHGGSRRTVQTCILCHTEKNSIDPDTGNTFDFEVMIHKIHSGKTLPSVVGGTKYQIIGNSQSVHDFSDVAYPGDTKYCTGCHDGTQSAPFNDFRIKVCQACHDRTYFGSGSVPAGWTMHTGGVHTESECVVCHGASSIAPIDKAHKMLLSDPQRPNIDIKIKSVTNSSPGQKPEVLFSVTVNGSAKDVINDRMTSLTVRWAGPNTDYTTQWSESIALAPECTTAGCLSEEGTDFRYYSNIAISSSAVGSYSVGFESAVTINSVKYNMNKNPVFAFAVTDTTPVVRRTVVKMEQCNTCHQPLGFHGGSRTNPQYCVFCHNTTFISSTAPPLNKGESVIVPSINLKDLVHRIHSGTTYPDSLGNCAHCHDGTTYTVPVPSTARGSNVTVRTCNDPAPYVGTCTSWSSAADNIPPESAACTSCHDSKSAQAHAAVNSTSNGTEACATCHASGKTMDVSVVHASAP